MSQIVIGDTASIMGDVSQFAVSHGTSPVVPVAGSGLITIKDGNGIEVTGGLNQLTFDQKSDALTYINKQTIDATTADLITITVANGSAYVISGQIIFANAVDYSDSGGGGAAAWVYNIAGDPKFQQNISITYSTGISAGVSVQWIKSGNDLILRATGAAGVTYNWRGKYNYSTV